MTLREMETLERRLRDRDDDVTVLLADLDAKDEVITSLRRELADAAAWAGEWRRASDALLERWNSFVTGASEAP